LVFIGKMKLKLSSVFETSRYIATKSGAELREALEYIAEFSQQVVTALNAKLSYGDNFLCEVKQISLANNTETVVSTDSQYKAKEVRLRRLISSQYYQWSSWGWTYNAQGQLVVQAAISGTPSGQIPAEIIIYYQ
jgi:hypothetical protein